MQMIVRNIRRMDMAYIILREGERMKKRGFTLIELMIVVAIIGILASIAIPNFLKFQTKARQVEARTNLASVAVAEISYFAEKNNWAFTLDLIGWQPQGAAKYKYSLGTDPLTYGASNCNNGTTNCLNNCAPDGTAGIPTDSIAGFTAIAEGNVDSDTTTDCWFVESTKAPVNYRNDVNL